MLSVKNMNLEFWQDSISRQLLLGIVIKIFYWNQADSSYYGRLQCYNLCDFPDL